MIGVDWGTSTLRAFRLAADGRILERRAAKLGVLQVAQGGFPAALQDMAGAWLQDGERHVLLSGMVGSRQGWQEAPYLPCPAGLDELAGAVVPVAFAGAAVRLVPGLSAADASGVPEVMRGEEVQILGALAGIGQEGIVCLPGSHAKWARVAAGRIAGFSTYLTGETFAALRGHTILGRTMTEGAEPVKESLAAFDRGLARSDEPGGLLHHLFGVRALALAGRLAEAEGASYLSGLLIGHEVRAALAELGESGRTRPVHLIGAAPLCALYARAIAAAGGVSVTADEDAAARGLAAIGGRVSWE